MARICRQCGKRFTESVLKHYEKNHKNVYLVYASKIAAHPNMYAADEDSAHDVASIKATLQPIHDIQKRSKRDAIPEYVKEEQQVTGVTTKKKHEFNTNAMRQLVILLETRPQEQTYRGGKMFICDCCYEAFSSGRVVFNPPVQNWHVCYNCYKHAKERTQTKRGNRHVVILTPMRN